MNQTINQLTCTKSVMQKLPKGCTRPWVLIPSNTKYILKARGTEEEDKETKGAVRICDSSTIIDLPIASFFPFKLIYQNTLYKNLTRFYI